MYKPVEIACRWSQRAAPGRWVVIAALILLRADTGRRDDTLSPREVADWSQGEASGWRFADSRDKKHDGRIVVRGEALHVEDGEDGQPGYAEVSRPGPLVVGSRFAVELRARFLQIGLARRPRCPDRL